MNKEIDPEVVKRIGAARELINALCTPCGLPGHRDWVMSIPARPDYDPDIVIADALRACEQELDRLGHWKAEAMIAMEERADWRETLNAKMGKMGYLGWHYLKGACAIADRCLEAEAERDLLREKLKETAALALSNYRIVLEASELAKRAAGIAESLLAERKVTA